MARGNAALPALIIVGAGVYFLAKSKPSAPFALGVTSLLAKVKGLFASPQSAPQIQTPNVGPAQGAISLSYNAPGTVPLLVQQIEASIPPPQIEASPLTPDGSFVQIPTLPLGYESNNMSN